MKKITGLFGLLMLALTLAFVCRPAYEAEASAGWTEVEDVDALNKSIDTATYQNVITDFHMTAAGWQTSGITFEAGQKVSFVAASDSLEFDFDKLCSLFNPLSEGYYDINTVVSFTGNLYVFFLDGSNRIVKAFRQNAEYALSRDQFATYIGGSFSDVVFDTPGAYRVAVGTYFESAGTIIGGTDRNTFTVKAGTEPKPEEEYFYNEGYSDERTISADYWEYWLSTGIENEYCRNIVPDTMSYKTGTTTKVSGKVDLTDDYRSKLGVIYAAVQDENGRLVDYAAIDSSDFKPGTTAGFSAELNFYEKGLHTLMLVSLNDRGIEVLARCEKLKVILGENSTAYSVSVDKPLICVDDRSAAVKVSYMVPANNVEYVLKVGKYYDRDVHDYNFKAPVLLGEYSTELDELERDGKTHDLTFKGPFKEGCYKAELTDLRTGKAVAEAVFIVTEKKYCPIELDEANKKIPFTYSLSTDYLELEPGKSVDITYQYEAPYDKYLEALQEYYATGYTTKLSKYTTAESFKKIVWKPADGSTQYELTALYEQFKFLELDGSGLVRTMSFDADYIYDSVNDRFDSLLSDASGKNGQIIITMGSNVIRINVGASAELLSVKVNNTTQTRAYGESFTFYTKDAAGGKVVVEIYNSKKKLVRTLTTTTSVPGITMEETAEGMLSWDLKNEKGKYVDSGKYTAKVYLVTYALDTETGKDKTEIKSEPVEIKLTLKKFSGKPSMSPELTGEGGGAKAPLESPVMGINLKLNVGCKVKLVVKNSSGTKLKTYNYVWGSGDYTGLMVDLSSLNDKLKVGSKYTVSITAETIEGKTCKGSATFKIVKAAKPSISNAGVSVANGLANFSFGISAGGNVKVVLKKSSGSQVSVAMDKSCTKGTVSGSVSVGGLAAGTYKLEITASNSGGKATVTKSFSIPKKVKKVTKPTLSNLKASWIIQNQEDALKIEVDYKGENCVIYYDIMYVDNEECVYSGSFTPSGSSGHATMVWDGNKSNGFRGHIGSYFVRVYAVNSGGKTSYLKKTFKINAG